MKDKSKIKNKKSKLITVVILSILTVLVLFNSLRSSLIFQHKGRINVLFYGQQSLFLSLSNVDLNYFMYFSPDEKTVIPGGYGPYRLGALGKLVSLEKNPDLFRRTFSSLTASFTDEYFYPVGGQVYYTDRSDGAQFWPGLTTFLTPGSANLIDRLYLAYLILHTPKNTFTNLSLYSNFFKDHPGYLYQSIYRNERRNVQILYHSEYQTATSMSQLLEGEGINVADLSQSDKTIVGCMVVEKEKAHSVTAIDLANFFHCKLTVSATDPYDILFYLGNLEKDWET